MIVFPALSQNVIWAPNMLNKASTLEITSVEQRALRKFPASWNLSLLKRCFAPSNLADTYKTGQQAQSYRGSTNSSSLQPIMPALFNMPFAAKLLRLASRESMGGR